MNLYFQFLTQNQSTEAIRLIQIPCLMWQSPLAGMARLSTEGVISRVRFTELESLSSRLQKKQFAEMQIGINAKGLRIGTTEAQVRTVEGLFTSSATSALWRPCRKWSMAVDGTVGNRWMNAKNREDALTYHKVKRAPSIFELALEVRTSISPEDILAECAVWLARVLPEVSRDLRVFGCGDVGGSEMFVVLEGGNPYMLDLRVMSSLWPRDYPKLGARMDAMHPVLFGSTRLCEGISSALGGKARLIKAKPRSERAVVLLRPKCNLREATFQARKWLIASERPGQPA
jgi:hypothetical protein